MTSSIESLTFSFLATGYFYATRSFSVSFAPHNSDFFLLPTWVSSFKKSVPSYNKSFYKSVMLHCHTFCRIWPLSLTCFNHLSFGSISIFSFFFSSFFPLSVLHLLPSFFLSFFEYISIFSFFFSNFPSFHCSFTYTFLKSFSFFFLSFFLSSNTFRYFFNFFLIFHLSIDFFHF